MNNNELGKLIMERRTKLNMTQKDLADKLFVSSKTVSRFEMGGAMPNVETMQIMAKVLKININKLISARLGSELSSDEEVLINVQKLLKESRVKQNILISMFLIIIGNGLLSILNLIYTGAIVKMVESNDLFNGTFILILAIIFIAIGLGWFLFNAIKNIMDNN